MKFLYLVGIVVLLINSASCSKTENNTNKENEARVSKVDDTRKIKKISKKVSPHERIVRVFKKLEKIISENSYDPKLGAEKCLKYVDRSTAKVEKAAMEIDMLEAMLQLRPGKYTLMSMESAINEMRGRMLKVLKLEYGIDGVECVMKIADLSNAARYLR